MRLFCPKCKSRCKTDTFHEDTRGYRAEVVYYCGARVDWHVTPREIEKTWRLNCGGGKVKA